MAKKKTRKSVKKTKRNVVKKKTAHKKKTKAASKKTKKKTKKKAKKMQKSTHTPVQIENAVFNRHPAVLYRELKNEIQLIHLEQSSETMSIDGLAAHVWLALNGSQTSAQLIEKLQNGLQISEAQRPTFRKDVIGFLADLKNENMIVTIKAGAR